MKQFPERELSQAFDVILNLYGHEFNIPEIDHLLKIGNLAPIKVFKNLIELGKTEAAKFIVNNTEFDNLLSLSYILCVCRSKAIEEMVVGPPRSVIESWSQTTLSGCG